MRISHLQRVLLRFTPVWLVAPVSVPAIVLYGLLIEVSSAADNKPGFLASRDTASDIGASIQTQAMTQVGLALIFIILLIVCGAWVLRRMGQFNRSSDGAMKIVGILSVGSRERVVLVDVGGHHQLLLGVSPGRVTTLHDFQGDLEIGASDANGSAVSSPFGSMVKTLRQAAGAGSSRLTGPR